MGTNFFMMTRDKKQRDKWLEYDEYELTDTPDWGYEVHVAKTSGGWKPLFESHRRIRSVKEYREMYDEGWTIHDEYGNPYTWDDFKKRVLDFNKDDPTAYRHPDPAHRVYGNDFFSDCEGYDFDTRWFR